MRDCLKLNPILSLRRRAELRTDQIDRTKVEARLQDQCRSDPTSRYPRLPPPVLPPPLQIASSAHADHFLSIGDPSRPLSPPLSLVLAAPYRLLRQVPLRCLEDRRSSPTIRIRISSRCCWIPRDRLLLSVDSRPTTTKTISGSENDSRRTWRCTESTSRRIVRSRRRRSFSPRVNRDRPIRSDAVSDTEDRRKDSRRPLSFPLPLLRISRPFFPHQHRAISMLTLLLARSKRRRPSLIASWRMGEHQDSRRFSSGDIDPGVSV